MYCCGGERSAYYCGGAEESKRDDGEEGKDSDSAAALPHAVAPLEAPSVRVQLCGGTEERQGYGGDAAVTFKHVVAPVGAPSAAALRRVARFQ
jgi:hypothetical protein